ncbi:MAG: ketoacyl-ACP synthase III [Bacteroidales bacterium]|nr:ketoacyl-ACP synthase III [Bacteroidales bacterium]
MSLLSFNGIGITAMSAAVPKHIIKNLEYTEFFPKDQVAEIVEKTGILERRFADKDTCSSDLCFAAAEKLFEDNSIDRSEIDVLIFVSQTPDFRMPATSIVLQDKLGLSTSCIAFDINLGCSGFIYGLSTIYSFMQQEGLRKALLLDGETRSKVYSPKDRNCAFLFGDGGIAALIEKDKRFGESFFSLNSDGSRKNLIKIEGGGYRMPSSVETVQERVVDKYGNIRTLEQGYMNGGDVFNFVIREIPRDIKNIVKYSNSDMDSFDYYVFHQANNFINAYLAKKLKLNLDKIPSTIAKYGNTSSVSLPLTIVSELKNELLDRKKVLMSAFGVGMTWASCILYFDNCKISDIVEI